MSDYSINPAVFFKKNPDTGKYELHLFQRNAPYVLEASYTDPIEVDGIQQYEIIIEIGNKIKERLC